MVCHRVLTMGGQGWPERAQATIQARVFGSEGYPEPRSPYTALASSRSASRVVFAKIEAAPTVGYRLSAFGSMIH